MVPRKGEVSKTRIIAVPASVWCLGFVTLLKNMSSVIVTTFSPLFLRETLGVSILTLGIFEGGVEAVSFFARIFAGVISDSLKKRKLLILIGYILGFLGRIFLALSSTVWEVFISRSCERVGNGVQASPRDALVADLSTPENRGACYGLRQSLTMAGSLLGAIVGMLLMWGTAHNYRLIFFLTLIPSSLAILLLIVGVKEPPVQAFSVEKSRFCWSDIWRDLLLLPPPYWKLIILSFLFMIGFFSISFIVLRLQEGGVGLVWLPLVMIIQNLAATLSAFPSGRLADRIDRRYVLLFGFCVLASANTFLALSNHYLIVLLATLLWGVQFGITQSSFMAFVAESTPKEVRGTGFGVFHFVNGVAVLMGNGMMGFLWDRVSPTCAFTCSVGAALTAILFLWILIPAKKYRL